MIQLRKTQNPSRYHLSTVICLLFWCTHLTVNAQCPTEAQLEGGGTFDVPTDSDCSSPVSCPLATTAVNINANVTILSCATLNLTQTAGAFTISGGTFTIDDGGTFTVNRRLLIDGATLIVNGELQVGDLTDTDNLAVEGGGSIQVGSTGNINVTNGSIRIGTNGAGSPGSITIDGTVSASGNVTIRPSGTLGGSGMLTYGGTYDLVAGGMVTGSFTNCMDGSNNSSCGDTVLPVSLISFTATSTGSGVAHLHWVTASELNNYGFHIERSTDGIDFEEIGFVEGHGTTDQTHEYNYQDKSVSVSSYYRLRQEDYDGQYEYSTVSFASLAERNNEKSAGIYPNPVVSQFSFTDNLEGVYDWSLVNVSGSTITVAQNMTVPQAQIYLNETLSRLDRGIYLITLQNQDTQQRIRLLKQ